MGNPLVDEDLRRAQDLVLLTLREDDPLRIVLRAIDDHAHELQAARDEMLEPMLILLHLAHRNARDAALFGRLRHRRRHGQQNAVGMR